MAERNIRRSLQCQEAARQSQEVNSWKFMLREYIAEIPQWNIERALYFREKNVCSGTRKCLEVSIFGLQKWRRHVSNPLFPYASLCWIASVFHGVSFRTIFRPRPSQSFRANLTSF